MATKKDISTRLTEDNLRKLREAQKKVWSERVNEFLKKKWVFDDVVSWVQSKRNKLKTGDQKDNITTLDNTTSTSTIPDPNKTNQVTETTETTPTQTTETTQVTEDLTPWVKTLRDQVADLSIKKTREQRLKEAREESGRWELVELQKWFRREASNVQEDIENITKWLEAEWWAITKIAASRIREARSAPLREQLTSLVKWQELTSDSLQDLDKGIEWILEARKLDREDELRTLTWQIESSDLSSEEKNRLLTQLWTTTARKQREEELEVFRQKEIIKAQVEKADIESLAKTWLTAEQNLQAARIIQDFDVKEDSIAWQSIRKLLKEWKTNEQINKILWLAEWTDGKIDDEQFTRQEKLRKEFEWSATVKNYLDATQQFAGIVSTLWTASWPGDIAWVFQFMKSLDPSSVVRESEFSSAASSSGIVDRVTSLQLLKRAEKWEILTPKQRKQFVDIAKVLFENRKEAFDERARKFIWLSKEAGANPKSVVLDFDNIPWIASDITEDELQPIWPNSTDEEILKFVSKWWWQWNTFNLKNIWDASDDDIWSFLDFNWADQTAQTKVWIENIWLWNVTQEFWATSPLKIDNVRLADGSVWTPWIDIDGKIWDNIPSTISWTVKIIESNDWLWNRVIVLDEEWNEHFFNHLQWFNVKNGQKINKWDIIGTMWNSWSVIAWPWWDGSHLDYRVKSKKWWIDPTQFLNS